MTNPFRYFNSSPEVIRLVVMMYVRYPLSLRNVEDLLAERGIDISHETVRFWWNRFGPIFAAEIRKRRGRGLAAAVDAGLAEGRGRMSAAVGRRRRRRAPCGRGRAVVAPDRGLSMHGRPGAFREPPRMGALKASRVRRQRALPATTERGCASRSRSGAREAEVASRDRGRGSSWPRQAGVCLSLWLSVRPVVAGPRRLERAHARRLSESSRPTMNRRFRDPERRRHALCRRALFAAVDGQPRQTCAPYPPRAQHPPPPRAHDRRYAGRHCCHASARDRRSRPRWSGEHGADAAGRSRVDRPTLVDTSRLPSAVNRPAISVQRSPDLRSRTRRTLKA